MNLEFSGLPLSQRIEKQRIDLIMKSIQDSQFECNLCYCLFNQRQDQPDLKVCLSCLPDPVDLPYSCCPKCGWDSDNKLGCDDAPVKYSQIKSDWEYGYAGGCTWKETWLCPECSTIFELDQSNL